MANIKNDDMDRIGNRNTPQGSATPGTNPQANTQGTTGNRNVTPGSTSPQSQDRFDTERDRLPEQGRESFGRNTETDSSRNTGRDLDDESE